MRTLIVGAGASLEEAQRIGAPRDLWFPTMENFAEKLWCGHNTFFNYWLDDYLGSCGISSSENPTNTFIAASKSIPTKINIERLFEYCWLHRGEKHENDWSDLITHGVLNPLTFLFSQIFFENGVGTRQLSASQQVANKLQDGDVVLNLNYDTLFETAAEQSGKTLSFVPNKFSGKGLRIAKPHGSFNLLANNESFFFSQPDCMGATHSSGDNFRNHTAIVPPRFNKTYDQHPIAALIIQKIADCAPQVLTFWGVGLTDSDTDLLSLYKTWAASAQKVEAINPDNKVATRISDALEKPVNYFNSLDQWLENT